MSVTTTVEGGRIRGLHVQSGIKAADGSSFHNQAQPADRTRGLRVRTGVQVGPGGSTGGLRRTNEFLTP